MRLHQLLEHHRIVRNPFAEEDAQTDHVFKDFCIASTYHPSWDKVYGDPSEPSTSVVFGEKGSGKTAIRLQIARHLRKYNESNPERRVFVVHYDDFNSFLGHFSSRLGRRGKRPDRVLSEWKLWDHMDSILSLCVTGTIDRILEVRQPSNTVECDISQARVDVLDRHQARDLLLLATCYDQSTSETFEGRWNRLRRRLGYRTWYSAWDFGLGIAGLVGVLTALAVVTAKYGMSWLPYWWAWLAVAAGMWTPWCWHFLSCWRRARGILAHMRVGTREVHPLRRVLMQFPSRELSGQPLPNRASTDGRYELLLKFQSLLQSLGYASLIVLVDRVDEPHLINGSAELMRALIWPMLDNKFLKQEGLGLKLMLPIELTRFVEREDREFFQKARLDKQNMVASFQWTGETLYDIANARLRACTEAENAPTLREFFDQSLPDRRLIDSLRSLRTPRHLFKFLHRLLVTHCNAHTDEAPVWQIPAATFESSLAVYLRDQDAFDRGVGPG